MIGYGYEFISPANFDLPLAKVKNGILAPDGPAYKVLVLRSNDLLTLAGTEKLVQFAKQGLPIIIQGGIPTTIASANGLQKAQENIKSILSLKNVRQVGAGPLAPALAAMGIEPRTKVSMANCLTYWRHDSDTETDYGLVFNDGANTSTGSVTFDTQKTPFFLNAWTGIEEPVVEYVISASKQVTIPFTLAPGQNALVVFRDSKYNESPKNQVTSAPANLGYVYSKENGISIKVPAASTPGRLTLSNSKTVQIPAQKVRPAITLGNWKLIAESWKPGPDLYDSATIGTKTNKTFILPVLASWPDISGLKNTSGVGYYSTNFTWNKSDGSGAIIDFGPIQNTIRVRVNGKQIPPLDFSAAKADISAYLKEGVNVIEPTVATTLYNGLVPILPLLKSSGDGLRFGYGIAVIPGLTPPSVPAGLLGTVTVTPFNLVPVA